MTIRVSPKWRSRKTLNSRIHLEATRTCPAPLLD